MPAHRQHRAFHFVEDALGDGTEERPPPAVMPVRSDDEQIRLLLLRGARDRGGRRSDRDEDFVRKPAQDRIDMLLHLDPQARCVLGRRRVDERRDVAEDFDRIRDRVGVHHRQLRPEPVRQHARVAQRGDIRFAQVGRGEKALGLKGVVHGVLHGHPVYAGGIAEGRQALTSPA